MPPTPTSSGTSIRNTTLTPIVLVSGEDVLFIKPREMVVYPHETILEKGVFGLLPARMEPELQVRSGADRSVTIADTDDAEAAAPNSIRNSTSHKVIVLGSVGDNNLAPTYLPPGKSIAISEKNGSAKASLTIFTGAAYFEVRPLQLAAMSDTIGVPLVAVAAERFSTSRRNMRTYLLVKGQHYEERDPYTVMLDIVTDEDTSVPDLPELKRCETLPAIQLSTSSRVTLASVGVSVGVVLLAILIVLGVTLSYKRRATV